jgi:H+/Cl- antiporter ClcA
VTTQTPKISSRWWYLFPIFLGVIGGIVSWVVLKSHDRKLAKNCLVLGVIFVILEIMILVGLLLPSDNLNLVTEFETVPETSDFEFQFQINTP